MTGEQQHRLTVLAGRGRSLLRFRIQNSGSGTTQHAAYLTQPHLPGLFYAKTYQKKGRKVCFPLAVIKPGQDSALPRVMPILYLLGCDQLQWYRGTVGDARENGMMGTETSYPWLPLSTAQSHMCLAHG